MIEHAPWLGSAYAEGVQGQRVALVGYSHYAEGDGDTEEQTTDTIKKVMGGDTSAFFDRLRDYFAFPDHATFWPQVLFFNFVPTIVGGPEDRYAWANDEQLRAGQARVLRLIADHEPHKLIVFSKKAWRSFPLTNEDKVERSGHDPCDWQTYETPSGHRVIAAGLRHPQGAVTAEMQAAVASLLAVPLLPSRSVSEAD